jgi:phage-related protein
MDWTHAEIAALVGAVVVLVRLLERFLDLVFPNGKQSNMAKSLAEIAQCAQASGETASRALAIAEATQRVIQETFLTKDASGRPLVWSRDVAEGVSKIADQTTQQTKILDDLRRSSEEQSKLLSQLLREITTANGKR